MKAPFIFMNEESEYFYIFPNVFFSKSKGAFFEELDIICRRKGKCCLNRLPLNYLTPEKLFKFIDYTIS